jgi:cobalt-zinc-cadmium efflux system membrane fusion protein
MRLGSFGKAISFALMSLLIVCGAGCGQQEGDGGTENPEAQVSDTSDEGHDHGDWWCVEHGLPEEECSICSSKAADEFKAKDDWCEEHGRAESQCFICDPSRAEKFAALYEAKFGHKPPKPTE